MTLVSRLTRAPRPYNPDRAAEALAALSVPAAARDLVAGTAGCSPYLARLLGSEAAWVEGIWDVAPGASLAALLSEVAGLEDTQVATGLRRAKRRVALLTALADLGGAWRGHQVTQALTDFADAALDRAIRAAARAPILRGKLPGQTEADLAQAGGMVALAMGKMGAGELNYSSDIDLICLFDEDRFDPADFGDARQTFIRITRAAMALLSDVTGEGYVFRTDLRLRPDPSVTPVCLSMEAAERYYEALGRTWERAAHIKARPAAGDLAAGARYLDRLRPFVYRKHLDFAAVQDAHDIRLKLRHAKGVGSALVLEGHNVKLGLGGIREIEFFTQTRQLIAGGRDTTLRDRATLPALAALAAAGWVPQRTVEDLSAAYTWNRDVEHRLQMVQDAQTHTLPQRPEEFDRLAAFFDMDTADLRRKLKETFAQVEALTDPFFTPDVAVPVSEPLPFSADMLALVDRWDTYPALRSERARGLFDQLRPDILRSLALAVKPDEALLSFNAFIKGLPSGVQVFSLFAANRQLIDLLVDICATAPDLGHYLARNAAVLDAVIGGDFFAPLPSRAALRADLAARLRAMADYEAQLLAARLWQREAHFRIGVHSLRGLIGPEEAAMRYADLADAVLQAIWPCVLTAFEEKHGRIAGQGAAVIAMGSLGARGLSARSDLDLIVVYDVPSDGDTQSDGRKPLALRLYFARLTQALITALTAPMGAGRLYEVDMRLRPSGKQGPVATGLDSFTTYQQEEAWVWEHLALTRARVVLGHPDLAARIEAVRRDILTGGRFGTEQIRQSLREMREKFATAGRDGTKLLPKTGPGRMQEIELLAQANALVAGSRVRGTLAQLTVSGGLLTPEQAACLAGVYGDLARYQQGLRLLTAEDISPDDLGEGGRAFVLRQTDKASIDDLRTALTDGPAAADATMTQVLQAQ